MQEPVAYVDRWKKHPNGMIEWVCYWCNAPVKFEKRGFVAHTVTKKGQYGGVVCPNCERERRGQFAHHPVFPKFIYED